MIWAAQREKTYHHSRFRDQAWPKMVLPDPLVQLHPRTTAQHSFDEGQWVLAELAGGPGSCRLKMHLSAAVPDDVPVTGMGWSRSDDQESGFGALDININAALGYGAPYDPASGSPRSAHAALPDDGARRGRGLTGAWTSAAPGTLDGR